MKLFCLLLVGVMLMAQSPVTTADISGDGAAHVIATSGTAAWITFQAPATNATTNCSTASTSGCVRVGDSSISATRGIILVPGGGFSLIEPSGATRYTLSQWYYFVSNGDKVVVTYGK